MGASVRRSSATEPALDFFPATIQVLLLHAQSRGQRLFTWASRVFERAWHPLRQLLQALDALLEYPIELALRAFVACSRKRIAGHHTLAGQSVPRFQRQDVPDVDEAVGDGAL